MGIEVRGFLRFFAVERIHFVREPVTAVRRRGAAGDSAAVIRALRAPHADRSDRPSYLTLCDPPAAALAQSAGVGASLSLSLGRHS